MSIRIYKESYFEASHRLLHYKGKCFRLHGHQWRAEFWMEGDLTPESMILVDYNLIKEVVLRYDHEVILNKDDPMVECLSKFQDVVLTDGDPTSELLAERISSELEEECRKNNINARVVKCRIWESTSCYAEWTP
ncbi:6-carboxytetrahydropterin synthase [Methanomicrobium antiquum]|uniref:6-carboxytetrahydropterin synthase n=1 Tax=Methanomicrobium antiquum TaxID=487686 RepID=A0AAF0JLJ3_9EURY|nr:6-carboxytetrahydropterin synthase [Methanomicrobium antiquum]MDD3977170.1 6-carboxytetrahydropterin synthase [Methanomicrobium sp.]WFN36162.1 6-carboxytetrahydropterin synthase [Methanomicrobium antiquum]